MKNIFLFPDEPKKFLGFSSESGRDFTPSTENTSEESLSGKQEKAVVEIEEMISKSPRVGPVLTNFLGKSNPEELREIDDYLAQALGEKGPEGDLEEIFSGKNGIVI